MGNVVPFAFDRRPFSKDSPVGCEVTVERLFEVGLPPPRGENSSGLWPIREKSYQATQQTHHTPHRRVLVLATSGSPRIRRIRAAMVENPVRVSSRPRVRVSLRNAGSLPQHTLYELQARVSKTDGHTSYSWINKRQLPMDRG